MQIGNKDICQFGEQYIDIDTGQPATEEEISLFWVKIEEDRKLMDEISSVQKEKDKKESKEWHAKYDPSMKEFFNEEDDPDWEPYGDEDDLIYALSTVLFDHSAVLGITTEQEIKERRDEIAQWFPGTSEDSILKNIRDFDEILEEMKKAFPDYWEEALEGYKDGSHDT